MKPSVNRKATVGESPRGALNRRDFVQQRTGEEDHLILLRHDGLIVPGADVLAVFPSRVVNSQLASPKVFRLTVEEINKGQLARSNLVLAVVIVVAEEVPIVAGSNLGLDPRDRKNFAPHFLQNPRQIGLNTIEDDRLVLPDIHQHPRATMFIIEGWAGLARRNHFAEL